MAARFAASLVLTGSARSRLLSAALAIALSAVALLVTPDIFKRPPFVPDEHLRSSLNLALNAGLCHRVGYVSITRDVTSVLINEPSALFVPLRTLVEQTFGSVETYCGTVTVPLVNNENAHLWLLRLCLWLRPSASMAEIGRVFAALRFLVLAFMAYALLRAGASVLLVLAVTVAGFELLRELASYQYGMYPFVFTAPLLLISLGMSRLQSTRRINAADLLAAGFVTAFFVNLRTSHAPVYVALMISFVAAFLLRLGLRSLRAREALVSSAAFIAGYAVFHFAFITPLRAPGATMSANHSVAHPLVLGLAVPESPFSRREGIQWTDSVGLTLAQRVDPKVVFLSPEYNAALWRYYRQLWSDHPADMRNVYAVKFRIAGADAVREAGKRLAERGVHWRWISSLAESMSGAILLAFAAVASVAGFVYYVMRGSILAFAAGQISLVAGLLILESALIMPLFYVAYDGPLLFFVFIVPIALLQLVLDGLAASSPIWMQ